jgi:nucleotide-binding universal stress UspA family protein
VDFSAPAELALQAAVLLAQRFHSQVVVARVGPRKGEVAGATEPLAAYAQARLGGIPVTAAVAAGDPARELARLARQAEADLILVGGHSGPPPLVTVGFHARLTELAPCPVIAIGSLADARLLAAAFEALPLARCRVCGRPLGETVCAGCRAVIVWEAMERTWAGVLHEGPGLMGLGAARALGPVVGPPARESSRPTR